MAGIIAFGILALVTGMMLARSYLAAVLAPAGFAFFLAAFAWGIICGSGFVGVALSIISTVTCLDFGYVFGYFVWRIIDGDYNRLTLRRRHDSRGVLASGSLAAHIRAALQF
jgi:hypothetical protein